MGKKEKLRERLLTAPSDFKWDELVKVMTGFGYKLKSRTSGSACFFHHEESNSTIYMHRPHPKPIVKVGALKQVIEKLKEQGFIDE